MKILIADDSKASRMLLKNILEEDLPSHCDFIFAKDGEEAVTMFIEHQPEIAFFDLTMPKQNGMEALEEVLASFPHAKIVVVTADGQKINHDKAMQIGAIDYINKPLSLEKIKRKLQVWL